MLSGPEHIPPGKIKQAVIFLHGLGSNGDDLMGLMPFMEPSLPNTAFLSPNAPYSVPMAYNGFQWFDLWERTPMQIEHGVREAAPAIAAFIESVAARFKLPHSKIALVGLSQGTMMALHVGLRIVNGLAGIVGFSGAMVGPETLKSEKVKNMPPVLLVHGMQDPIVSVFLSQQANNAIQDADGQSEFIQRPFLVHSIDNEGIAASVEFLQDCFKGEK